MKLNLGTPINSSALPFLLVVVVWIAVTVSYLLPVMSPSQRAEFTYQYADLIFLTALLPLLVNRLWTTERHSIERLFWFLLGGAILCWWLLTIMFNLYWTNFNTPAKNLVSGLAYFLFYALMIAGAELKGYEQPKQLLSLHSSIVWLSSLTFILGSFVYFIIIPATKINYNLHQLSSTYLFYLMLDGYLCARWALLAVSHRKGYWYGYALLAGAMAAWLLSDAREWWLLTSQVSVTTGEVGDWLSFLPYLFFACAVFINVSKPSEIVRDSERRRLHLLNSPFFHTTVAAIVFVITPTIEQAYSFSSTDHNRVFSVWLVLLALLSVIQLLLFQRERRQLNNRLREAQFAQENFRQQLEQKTQQVVSQRDTYRSIIETTNNAIFTVDAFGKILSANQAAARLLEYSHQQLLKSSIQDLVVETDELYMYFTFKSYRQKLERQSRSIELESEFVNASGRSILVHVTLSLDHTNSEGPFVITLADISAQKQAEQEVIRMKDEFTANISHEFRTPLTIINGVLDNLKTTVTDPALAQQIDSAKTNGLRMVKMVEQLLELSRSGREDVLLTSIEATSICRFIADSFAPIAKQKDIQFNFIAEHDYWVTGNIQALEKIAFNLLSNAFKYTPAKGRVVLSLEANQQSITLTVEDNGPGIPKDEQPRVFERFYRTQDTDSKNIHGVGIGLALVKELCRRMGWDISLESSASGSVFEIVMPTSTPSVQDYQPAMQTSPIERNIESELIDVKSHIEIAEVTKSQYLVLVIEDNPDMQQHLNNIISREHQCLIASNGEEGIKMALDYLPDIIISDVMMPKMDGFEALKVLRRSELTAHIPVIMLTARSDTASRIEGLEAEADDYIAKPFDARELMLRVSNQIKSRLKLTLRLQQQWSAPATSKQADQPKVEDKFLTRLYECFEKEYHDTSLSMATVASKLAVSERQLQRKVKALLDLSPLEALRTFRINKAKAMLCDDIQVGLVAQQVGFSSQSHFGRLFKEQVGITPREFQKKALSQ